jgi:ribosomal protein S18 acetylase RimI-like enzyme
MNNINITKALANEISDLAILFDAYRVFYGAEPSLIRSIQFIRERIEKSDSTLFIAKENEKAIGFTQLYPLFSSVSMSKVLVLNDLFVEPGSRSKGIGEWLIKHALEFARLEGYTRMTLSTAKDNPAQKLYERIGFSESAFKFYTFNL